MIRLPERAILIRLLLRQRAVRAAAAACLLSVLLWTLAAAFSLPKHHRVAEAERSLARLRLTVAAASIPAEVQDAYRKGAERAAAVDRLLAGPVRQAEIVERLSRLASRAAVVLQSQSYKEGSERNGVAALNQELAIQGPYEGVRQFLIGIDRLPVLTLVLSIDAQRVGPDGGAVRAVLQLVTYREVAPGTDGGR